MAGFVLLLLIIVYVGIVWRSEHLQSHTLLYIASLMHVSLLGWYLSTMQWTNPKIGLVGVSWLLVAAAIWFLEHPKIRSILPALLSGNTLMLSMAFLAPTSDSSIEEIQIWVSLHLLLILIGYVGCILGGILGGAYIFVSARLKSRELREIRRWPALTTLARYNFVSIGFGTVGLLAGIVMGMFWALNMQRFHWDVTWVMSIALLGWYSIGLMGHLTGKQARWNAWISVVGLGSLAIFFVLTSILGSWHVGGMG